MKKTVFLLISLMMLLTGCQSEVDTRTYMCSESEPGEDVSTYNVYVAYYEDSEIVSGYRESIITYKSPVIAQYAYETYSREADGNHNVEITIDKVIVTIHVTYPRDESLDELIGFLNRSSVINHCTYLQNNE